MFPHPLVASQSNADQCRSMQSNAKQCKAMHSSFVHASVVLHTLRVNPASPRQSKIRGFKIRNCIGNVLPHCYQVNEQTRHRRKKRKKRGMVGKGASRDSAALRRVRLVAKQSQGRVSIRQGVDRQGEGRKRFLGRGHFETRTVKTMTASRLSTRAKSVRDYRRVLQMKPER